MQHLSETQTLKQFPQSGGNVNSTKIEEIKDIMGRAILEKPFTQDQIKHREGNFGKKLAYIEGHAVIQRLNDAFDTKWSFAVRRSEIINDTDEVMVLGQLEADGIVKCQFGSSRITRNRQSGEMVSLADDRGIAESFMGAGERKIRFTGHGIGLELDEFPFLAKGQKMELEKGMIIALEPKAILPGKGVVGIENTHVVTEQGLEPLTRISDKITFV